jgi:hypothetical protein
MARLRPIPRMIRGSCSSLPSLQLPFPPGGSRSQLIRRWAEHQMLKLFSLQTWRWEEGGPVGGYRVVVDNSGTTLCVPAEDFFSQRLQKNRTYSKEVEHLPALEDFVQKTTPGRRELRSRPEGLTRPG